MTDFLARFPLDWTDRRLRELCETLATAVYRPSEIRQLAGQAGISPASVHWEQAASPLWRDLAEEAARQTLLPALVEHAASSSPALRTRVDELLSATPVLSAQIGAPGGQAPSTPEVRWTNFGDRGEERQIVADDQTLLDVAFLAKGVRAAAAVCRLTVTFPSGKAYYGTAFRVGPSTLLTNHHVLYDGDVPAVQVEAAFGLEVDVDGSLRAPTILTGNVTSIRGERNDDYALISVDGLSEDVTTLPLSDGAPPRVDERVVIIQHPNGLPKKVALAHNLVRFVSDDVVQYWTDTEAGSSGSPVFNERWQVVALHHQWVESPEGDGVAYRNQGRAISRIVERIAAIGEAGRLT